MRDYRDREPLSAARGIMWGLVLSMGLWAVLVFLWAAANALV